MSNNDYEQWRQGTMKKQLANKEQWSMNNEHAEQWRQWGRRQWTIKTMNTTINNEDSEQLDNEQWTMNN